ncbi:D-alanyl-D-alanine carboxypeptidase [Acetobacteraceae bacterium H6797]|nr:D-alanyl-D-alanine carboxypeptidase [Acetobacteraceae bacterium H6797]
MAYRRELLGAVGAAILLGQTGQAMAQRAGARPTPASRQAAPPPTSPATSPLGPVDTVAREVILIDFDTGAVLLEKNPDERMTPSSMTKLMTIYILFDMLKQGRLKLDQTLPVSEKAWSTGGSRMFLELNSNVSIENLIRGIIIQSGNDACVVVAEGISGSEQQFAELMNEYGRRIGLKDSTFRNSNGWPDPEHRMTARDLSILARHIIADFPQYYGYFSERSFRWNNINQQNRDPLLGKVGGADGMKTGHTEDGGFGLVGTVKRGDRRLILVANGMQTNRQRSEESERLLEWGFREFENVTLFRAADTVEEVPVWLGDRPTVPMVGGRDLVLTLPRQWRRNMQVKVRYDAPLPAPVAKGQEIGFLDISGQGVPTMSLRLIAGADVSRLGMISRIPAVIGRWVKGA